MNESNDKKEKIESAQLHSDLNENPESTEYDLATILYHEFQKSQPILPEIISKLTETSVAIGQIYQKMTVTLAPILQKAKEINQILGASLEKFGINIEHVIKVTRTFYTSHCEWLTNISTMLGNSGWYFDLGENENDFSNFLDYCQFDIQNIETASEDIDLVLIEYFTANLQKIGNYLQCLFPHRQKFISEAIQAHIDGDYMKSVLLFLITADGITLELTEKISIFSKDRVNNTKLQIASGDFFSEKVENDILLNALYDSILNATAINVAEKDSKPGVIHRHKIVHGKDISYDTVTNSLKALSFLNYVATLLYGWIAQSRDVIQIQK